MNEFPKGWFYIHCPSRFDQVLTLTSATMQPTQKIELRPKQHSNRQLWTYNQGYLINKHTAYVLTVKDSKKTNQYIYPMPKQEGEDQRWKLDENMRLVLMDQPELGINDLAVPQLVEKPSTAWRCENDIIA
ncbi:hypothetical protein K501DRAFT_287690 [Backusella circina FSU 941]|nr:hypothetical protein K501DRAFT_287690 [Backusella circina FSU 941]